MDTDTFGALLRAARKRAGFHTIAAFADALSARGWVYSDDTLGNWETDRRNPYRSEADRAPLLSLFQLLTETGGIDDTAQIDAMLTALDRPGLSPDEKAHLFPHLDIPIPNLPEKPPYTRLVGREETLAALAAALEDSTDRRIVVVSGLGGIGKTALAYEAVRQAMMAGGFEKLAWETAKSEEFTGVSIRQRRDSLTDFGAVLASYARQLGFDDLAAQPFQVIRARLQNHLRQNRYVLVLDNLETLDAAQDVVRQLYEIISPGHSRILITSRERLVDETFVYDCFLRGLSEPASLELIRDEAESRGAAALLQAGNPLLHRIYTTTGGMPLALKLIVSQSLLGIALDEELARLEGAATEQDLYQFIYLAIWLKLSTQAKKLLIGAATFAASALRSMLQPVSELDDAQFSQAVPELIRASLMMVSYHALAAQQRYDIHPMTRWFINGPLTDLWNRQHPAG